MTNSEKLSTALLLLSIALAATTGVAAAGAPDVPGEVADGPTTAQSGENGFWSGFWYPGFDDRTASQTGDRWAGFPLDDGRWGGSWSDDEDGFWGGFWSSDGSDDESTAPSTPTPSATASPETASPVETDTPTPESTATATPEPTPTAVPESTPTSTPSPTPEPASTATPAPTAGPAATPTATPEPTPTATPESTPTATATATPEPTPTATPEPTPTATPEPTPTATPTPTPDDSGVDAARVERLVHEYVNDERTQRGLDVMSYDVELQEIARAHSEDMATRGYFSHTDPEGNDFSDRYERFEYECRAPTGDGSYLTGGENIAQTWYDARVRTDNGTVRYTSEEELARGIVTMWMNSQGHRENILNERWNNEGLGVRVTDENKVYATQNFC